MLCAWWEPAFILSGHKYEAFMTCLRRNYSPVHVVWQELSLYYFIFIVQHVIKRSITASGGGFLWNN
jgi:hypothetical protein